LHRCLPACLGYELSSNGLIMNTFLTDDTKATILLCAVLGKEQAAKPLAQMEYNALVRGLVANKMRPADLLQRENIPAVVKESGLDQSRLELLLGRGVQMGFALEEWQRSGIWIISRSDADYPTRLRKHLKDKAPSLLFGVGDKALLTGGGVAIVGSRNVDADGETFTRKAAELCVPNRMEIVSGGARGVDQIAMNAALNAGGIAIGVVAENLLRKSIERTARNAIADGRLLLISPYHPNAHFTVGTAMARNKFIYAMADYALIVQCEYKKGGTWTGAAEELKRAVCRPVFVQNSKAKGNCKLLELGAVSWPDNPSQASLSKQLNDLAEGKKKEESFKNADLFECQLVAKEEIAEFKSEKISSKVQIIEQKVKVEAVPKTIYEAVLPVILSHIEKPISSDELAKILDVNKTQLNVWLKKAVTDKKVRKLKKPVRYQAVK